MPDLLDYYDRYRDLVDDWRAFREALATPLPTCIWTNSLRITPEGLSQRIALETGATMDPVPWYQGAFRWPGSVPGGNGGSPQGASRGQPAFVTPGRTVAYAQGLFTPQEEAALLPALLMGPRPGERLLDLCAAPGNKTAQLAVALGRGGTVVANDLRWSRVSPLRRILERLGILNVVATAGNGVVFPEDPRHGPYDGVLVDVPCSCDATVRKSPKVMLRQGQERRRRTSGVQRALLRRAIALCRAGGRVVYSTCSFAPEENEAVVNDVLADPKGARVTLRSVAVPGLRLSPGVSAWAGVELLPEVAEKTVRLWPHHNDTGGFFVAVLDVHGPEAQMATSCPRERETQEPGGGLPRGAWETGQ